VRSEYRRRVTSDVWHFVKSCRWWPRKSYELRERKPTSGELCNECLAKERRS
jgi:hypothetical protein